MSFYKTIGFHINYERPENTVLEAIARLEAWYEYIDVPTKLSQCPGVGEVSEETLYKLAKRVRVVHEDGTVGWVKRLNTEDIVNILKMCL